MAWKRVRSFALIPFLLAAACAPATQVPLTSGGSAPPSTEAQDFILRIGHQSIDPTVDPHLTIGDVRRNGIYETLVAQDEQGKVIPDLASAWKNTAPTTWEFTLAQGRKFSDGSPLTADDVKFSYERGMNPDNKLGILVRIGTIEKVEIVNPQTFRITTKAPDPLLLKRAALVAVVSKSQVDTPTGGQDLASKGIGSGRYMIKEWVQNDRMIMVRNPHHPRPGGPSELHIRAIPEDSARVSGLRTGELDVIQNITVDQSADLKNAGFTIVNFNQGQSIGAFLFTTNEGRPTQNKLVRQALNYAIDKDTIAKTIYKGFTQPSGQLAQQYTFGYNPNLKPYPYDPAKAKQLLAQAGYSNGFQLKMDVPTNVSDAQTIFLYVQSQWKEIGLTPEMEVSSDGAFFLDRWYGRVQRGDMLVASLVNSPAMDADFSMNWFRGNELMPARRFENAEFDRIYNLSTSEMDEKKRAEYLQQAMAILHDEAPFLFLVDGVRLFAASPKVTNVNPRGEFAPDYSIVRMK